MSNNIREIMTLTDGTTLTKKQQLASLCGVYASVFAWGISFAGLVPLMSLDLESRGYSTLMIGVLGGISPVGVILAAPFVPRFIQKLGTAGAIVLSSIAVLITVLLLPIFDSFESWMVLRFVSGVFGAVPWIGTETWLNTIANKSSRGRVTALYGAIMATSFAIGPIMLSVLGTQGIAPYMYCAGLLGISLLPMLLIWRLAPVLIPPDGTKMSTFIWAMPTILAAAMVCGMIDMSFFSFLPIWGLRMGFGEEAAIVLLSIFVAGNVVLQFPIGWLADKTDRYLILIGCGIVGIICPLIIIYMTLDMASINTIAISIVLFVWGGCVWALYTVSLAIMGERYKGGELTAASAVFVVAYEISNIVGPPLAGISIEIWEPNGLMVFMFACATLFCVLSTLRYLKRRKRQAVNQA